MGSTAEVDYTLRSGCATNDRVHVGRSYVEGMSYPLAMRAHRLHSIERDLLCVSIEHKRHLIKMSAPEGLPAWIEA